MYKNFNKKKKINMKIFQISILNLKYLIILNNKKFSKIKLI